MRAPPSLVALVEWILVGSLVGVVCGTSSALFLWLLDLATSTRMAHGWLVFLLPLAGLGLGAAYERFGASVRGGTNLVIDAIHDGGPALPRRMAPLVLGGTLLTHLFGGSAGREGTAVQMGASLADAGAEALGISGPARVRWVVAGVAGGFGSVFGTPLAGAVFALEFVVVGRLQLGALVPALAASVVGDLTTRAWGIVHTAYPPAPVVPLTPSLLVGWLGFALGVAGVTVGYVELSHRVARLGAAWLPRLPLRMFVGGLVVVALWQLAGTDRYLGLGVPSIVAAFSDPNLPLGAFGWKVLFTVVTLGAGFVGGEVTPLFFVGGALGNVLARGLGLPLALGAGVGMSAVFGAASNTPIALSIMAVELFGAPILPHVAIVLAIAYAATGHRSIYSAQRLYERKRGGAFSQPIRVGAGPGRASPVVPVTDQTGDAPWP